MWALKIYLSLRVNDDSPNTFPNACLQEKSHHSQIVLTPGDPAFIYWMRKIFPFTHFIHPSISENVAKHEQNEQAKLDGNSKVFNLTFHLGAESIYVEGLRGCAGAFLQRGPPSLSPGFASQRGPACWSGLACSN